MARAKKIKGGGIFLHIPKTGGSFVNRVIKDTGLFVRSIGVEDHADVARVLAPVTTCKRDILRYYFKWCIGAYPGKNPFMFTFVRHPLSWYESWFKHCYPNFHYQGDEREWHPVRCLNGLGNPDFNNFVRGIAQKFPGFVTEMFSQYTRPPVAFIGKQENLTEDLITVLKQLDPEVDEDFIRKYSLVNVSAEQHRKPTDVVWDPDLRKQIYQLEYAGIVRYGYEKMDLHQPD
jgi:hypothetical protein